MYFDGLMGGLLFAWLGRTLEVKQVIENLAVFVLPASLEVFAQRLDARQGFLQRARIIPQAEVIEGPAEFDHRRDRTVLREELSVLVRSCCGFHRAVLDPVELQLDLGVAGLACRFAASLRVVSILGCIPDYFCLRWKRLT